MKQIIILGAIVVLVVAVWTGGWFFLAGEVRKNIELLASADGVTTPRVTCETLSVGGFPFRFDVDCQKGRVVNGDLVVDVPELRASVLVYRPTHLLTSAVGPVCDRRCLHRLAQRRQLYRPRSQRPPRRLAHRPDFDCQP